MLIILSLKKVLVLSNHHVNIFFKPYNCLTITNNLKHIESSFSQVLKKKKNCHCLKVSFSFSYLVESHLKGNSNGNAFTLLKEQIS